MRFVPLFTGMLLALSTLSSMAADPDQAIRKTLMKIQPDLPIEAISESAMPGIFQVQLKGGRLLYASADGQFLLQGNLYQMRGDEIVNLTEEHASAEAAKLLAKTPVSEMVVFAPEKPKTHITVFTDTDCGYCQKLHAEVPALNRLGVEVRYMAFPRQGVDSHGYNTLVSVWCSKDRQQAMNLAKSRQEVPSATCDNPVARQYQLGQMIGVNGTPAIVLANGQLIPGYQPAPELAELALKAK
jgi:thiol:disulfide interchange protein DsbC